MCLPSSHRPASAFGDVGFLIAFSLSFLRTISEFNHPQRDMSYTANFLYMMDVSLLLAIFLFSLSSFMLMISCFVQRLSEQDYQPNKTLVRALEILFILHAGQSVFSVHSDDNSECAIVGRNTDHELNCSTAAMRHISSRTGVVVLVHTVAEAHELALALLDALDERRHMVDRANFLEHAKHGLPSTSN